MSINSQQIRDPLHGVILIDEPERRVIDSRVFQRLRNIKQVGFADFAFPGATHTRFAHSLGAMYCAAKIFDRVFHEGSLGETEHKRFRMLVRLAALLHDVGHPPLSHTTEMIMPSLDELNGLPPGGRRATHEDYTLKLIRESELTQIINDNFEFANINAAQVAKILQKDFGSSDFMVQGINYGPILSQIISSEIDADRMDYLLRDSLYCGVNYGKFDSHWLMDNLIHVINGNSAYLGLKARAIFAFEDFLLSRYHMFASVYLHHRPVVMEKMLARFFLEAQAFTLPADVEAYIALDDIDLWMALRQSANPWARRIVRREPYVLLFEQCPSYQPSLCPAQLIDQLSQRLNEAGIRSIVARSRSALSHYAGHHECKLFVESSPNNLVSLEEYSQVFSKYETPLEFVRIFVDQKNLQQARKIIGE